MERNDKKTNNNNNNNKNSTNTKTNSTKTNSTKTNSTKTNSTKTNSTKTNSTKTNSKFSEQKVKGMVGKYLGKNNLISKNVYKILVIFILFLLVASMYFSSSGFRCQQSVTRIKTYHRYQNLKSINYKIHGEEPLHKFSISSSFNPCNTKNPIMDYTCLTVLKNILQSGARYIEVKIFNNKFGENTEPVISNGYKKGEWKMTLSTVNFEEFCKLLYEHAWTVNRQLGNNEVVGVANYKDPLFLGLNLATNKNLNTLNKIADLILNYFSGRLLSTRFTNLTKNLANIKMSDLNQRLVIFSSTGYQGSKLKELINAAWSGPDATIERLHFSELLNLVSNKPISEDESSDILSQYSDEEKLFIQKTRQKLHIIIPDKDEEMSLFKPQNYDTSLAFKLGCQFVCVYYQSVDKNMDPYITHYKSNGIVKINKSVNDLKRDPDIEQDNTVKDANFEAYKSKLSDAIQVLQNIRNRGKSSI